MESCDIKRSTGECLRNARRAAKLSQEKLAFEAGLDRTYISLLERGIRSPTLTTFLQICRALDQKPSILIELIEQAQELVAMEG